MKLVDLVPLKEVSAKAKALAKQYSMSQLQRMLDQRLGPDQEAAFNMPGFDPNEFSDSEDFGPSANDLDAAITIKRGGDVPYDVAIGRMTQDEYDEYMSTVKPDRDSFEKSSKFDRINETNKNMKSLKEAYTEMYETKKPNLKSIADVDKSGWTPDGGGGSIGYMEWEDGTEMTPQEIQDYFEANHELYDDIMQGLNEWYERGPATIDGKEVDVESIEMDGLGSMRKWGPDDGGPDAYILRAEFTDGTPLSDEQKERFADEYPEITQEKAQEQMEEGSCGYGPDGVPGDTPGETKGMDADNRTKIMIKKLVQKEIAKLNENKRIKKNN